MNNFINFSKWFQRGQLERRIISRLNKNYPNIEQNISAHRYLILPKIVVYSASTSSDSFLKTYTSNYSVFCRRINLLLQILQLKLTKLSLKELQNN